MFLVSLLSYKLDRRFIFCWNMLHLSFWCPLYIAVRWDRRLCVKNHTLNYSCLLFTFCDFDEDLYLDRSSICNISLSCKYFFLRNLFLVLLHLDMRTFVTGSVFCYFFRYIEMWEYMPFSH